MTITGIQLIQGKLNRIQKPLDPHMTLCRTFDGTLHKTVSYTRSEKEKKTCPKSTNFFDPGPGKKKLCLIERDDYIGLGAPVYGCNIASPFNPNDLNKLGQCRPDVRDGDIGKTFKVFT